MRKKFNVFIIILCLLFFNSKIVFANSEVIIFTPVNFQVSTQEYMFEIKEIKKIIKENNNKIEILKSQVDQKSYQLDKSLVNLINYDLELNTQVEQKLDKMMQTIIKSIIKISNIQDRIARQMKQANRNIDTENFENALINLDKVITLQEKEYEVLEKLTNYLDTSIQFIKGLTNK